MRSVHCLSARGLTLALVALGCAHCGSVKGAVKGGGDAGDDVVGVVDGGSTETDGASDASDIDASIPDSGGDATIVGPGNDHCTDATVIPLSGVNPRVDLMATTVGATHDVDALCSANQGADIFYQFTVSKRVIVYADTFGASWNTVLFLLSSTCTPITTTTPGDAVCNDDGCGTSQSQIVALLEPGSYRLGLAGQGSAQGAATIHFEWAIAGSGAIAQLPKVNSVQVGTTAGSGNIDGLAAFNECVAAGPENSYWWARCPSDAATTLKASTCGGAAWESVVEAQIPKLAPGLSSAYKCVRDSCGTQSSLSIGLPPGAGLGVVSVDGDTGIDYGPYTMTVTYTP